MQTLETVVSAATLYPDRARVTRSGRTTVVAGRVDLVITDLPPQVDTNSLRALACGTATARLLGVESSVSTMPVAGGASARELQAELDQAHSERDALAESRRIVTQERAWLDNLGMQGESLARGLAAGRMTGVGALNWLTTLRERQQELAAALPELSVKERDLERRIQSLESRLKARNSGGRKQTINATVRLDVAAEGEIAVELSYVTGGAGWEPRYDVRYHGADEIPRLEWTYLGEVSQQTGEDWNNVDLTLSTARPAIANELPELSPWYISPVAAYAALGGSMKAKKGRMMAFAAAAGGAADGEMDDVLYEEVEVETADVSQEGSVVTFHLPTPATIPPDGHGHMVTIGHYDLTPRPDYVCVPKLMLEVLRRVHAVNDTGCTFLAGEAALFEGDAYIGQTRVSLTPANGELDLYLGTEDGITVTRDLTKNKVSNKLLGLGQKHAYAYRIRLKNTLKRPARISVQDQLPVPRNPDIKVEVDTLKPTPTEHSELQLLTWDLELAAAGTSDIDLAYTVSHPSSMTVSDLP